MRKRGDASTGGFTRVRDGKHSGWGGGGVARPLPWGVWLAVASASLAFWVATTSLGDPKTTQAAPQEAPQTTLDNAMSVTA